MASFPGISTACLISHCPCPIYEKSIPAAWLVKGKSRASVFVVISLTQISTWIRSWRRVRRRVIAQLTCGSVWQTQLTHQCCWAHVHNREGEHDVWHSVHSWNFFLTSILTIRWERSLQCARFTRRRPKPLNPRASLVLPWYKQHIKTKSHAKIVIVN